MTLLVVAYLDWRATSFVVDHGELRLERGVFTKSSERIRSGPGIQSVDITEPFAARLLGLAEVTIDVGAEGGHRMRYLSRARAAAMRDYLLARAHGQRPAEVTRQSTTGVLDDLAAGDEVLVRVPSGRLVIGALLSHEFLLLTVPASVMIALVIALDPRGAECGARQPLAAARGRPAGTGRPVEFRGAPGDRPVALPVRTQRAGPQDHPRLDQPEQPARCPGIDLVAAHRAAASSGGAGWVTTGSTCRCWATTGQPRDEDQAGRTSILLPIGTRAEVDRVLRTIWPGLDLDAIAITPSPQRARWVQPLAQGWVGWGWTARCWSPAWGWLTRTQHVVPHARVQSLALQQGPLLRKLRLASVAVHTTQALAVNAALHLDADAARALLFAEAERARSGKLEGLFDK